MVVRDVSLRHAEPCTPLNESGSANREGFRGGRYCRTCRRGAYDQFQIYLELLLRWNLRVNLTAVREPEQIIQRHFVECAFAAQHLPRDIATLLDYGSGAGLPGIPIAICRPGDSGDLAEAQGKKAAFLREALRVLGLDGEVFDGRVETMPQSCQFDAVTMRAVEKMELAMPFAIQRAKRYLVLLTTEESAGAYRRRRLRS